MATAQEEDLEWNLNIDAAVGIDLGTTNSCVSVYKDGRITVIPDEHGNKLIPSVVAFESSRDGIKTFVGHDAIKNARIDQSHVVTEVKRLIGRKFDESAVQTNMKRWNFQVTANSKGNAQVSFCTKEQPRFLAKLLRHRRMDETPNLHLSPEDISSSILAKLKKMAENHLGKEVTHAVITVPAHFNNSQRKATMKAAELANLKVIEIINEPNAAALAYGIRSKVRQKRIILVMDVGGGTSDVALIKVVGEEFTVLTCKGDNNLGGEDFDTKLVNYCMEQMRKKLSSDVSLGKLQLRRLRNKCEQAKRILSENPDDPNWHYVIELDDFMDGVDGAHDFTLTISQKKFEELNQELFDKAVDLVTFCLSETKLFTSDVSDLVPVGGSMRIPKLREMLQNKFQGKQLFGYINPDEAIAVGAAIFAAQKLTLYSGHIVLSDITPFSLGIKGNKRRGDIKKKDVMFVIIPRNTKIPCKGQHRFWTIEDNQTTMAIDIYQGENEYVKDNMFLGGFEVKNVKSALAGETKIDVTLEVNSNGILKVTAEEVSTEKENVETCDLDNLVPHLNLLNVTQTE